MEISTGIWLNSNGQYFATNGLDKISGFELSVLVKAKSHDEYYYVLNYIVNHLITEKVVITAGQTIAYHSWMLKFEEGSSGYLDLYEAKADGEGFSKGVDHAIDVVNAQNAESAKFGVISLFPTFTQMVVISKGVLEGKTIDAVRYIAPVHMTGWYLTTDEYDDDIKSLTTVHYYHIAFNRPDLIKYLALPPGFRFYVSNETDVWFDEEVAK